MNLRAFRPQDTEEILRLFYDTVHTVNAADYTPQQLDAWAPGNTDGARWQQEFLQRKAVVCTEGDVITGFGDIDDSGYLDRLYVHKDYQKRGVATMICDFLEDGFSEITTHASITARPFFQKRGYQTVSRQEVVRSGIVLVNFVMRKKRP